MTQDMAFWSAKRLAAHIRRGKASAMDLLEHYLARMERYNPALNAIIASDIPGAKKRARAADRALAKGDVWGPLHGVPMTVKESFQALGLPTTWGVPMFRDNRPPGNALAVDRLLGAGAVIFGKTNVPAWLGDWQAYNDIYGTTNNPWDLARTPGGSSGGSAAALAAGLTGFELGSDIGGSIRTPAHFCGVYGHKPTYGICPPTGHALADWAAQADIAVVGPLGRSADDLAIGLAAIAGPDKIDAAGTKLALPAPSKTRLREFKVAVMSDHALAPIDHEVQALLQRLVAFLAKQRVKLNDTARPQIDFAESYRIYRLLFAAAISGGQTAEEFQRNRATAEALSPDDGSHGALMVRANVLYHKDWLGLNEQRHHLRRSWSAFFEGFDLLLCPIAPCPAVPHDHRAFSERTITVSGKSRPYHELLFWPSLPLAAYLPATVAPIGRTESGLPVGVQIIGPQYGDRSCIAFAQLLEREYQGFEPPPGCA
jgi:amidase